MVQCIVLHNDVRNVGALLTWISFVWNGRLHLHGGSIRRLRVHRRRKLRNVFLVDEGIQKNAFLLLFFSSKICFRSITIAWKPKKTAEKKIKGGKAGYSH